MFLLMFPFKTPILVRVSSIVYHLKKRKKHNQYYVFLYRIMQEWYKQNIWCLETFWEQIDMVSSHISLWNFPLYFSSKLYSLASRAAGFPSLPHLSGHHIYKVYQVCLQTGNGKWSYRFYPKSKDKRLHVDIDQGNFLCLIDWKFHFRFLFKDLLDWKIMV